jgi:pimeloyl-ACP methyl ester carboxylesterase
MFIESGAARIYTVTFGGGPRTLIAFGGWIGSWELWTEPFAELSASWRTIAYDHRGTGFTTAPTDTITLDTMVGDLFNVMDACGVDRCVVAAESAGAAVALQAALRSPERFAGLVLVSALYHREAALRQDAFVQSLNANYAATIAAFVDACAPGPDMAAIRQWGRQLLMRASPSDAVRLYESLHGFDVRAQLAHLTVPTLIVHGDADGIVPLQDATWLAATLPTSRLHVVRGAGHVPTVTHAHEIAHAINAFFALHMA